MANADIVCRDIRMTGKGRTRVARTCGARPGVSLASAERGKAIGDSRNGYRRNALYALSLDGAIIYDLDASPVDIKNWWELENTQVYFDFVEQYGFLFQEGYKVGDG